jgi:4'-phosphopantetheinyl transferase
MFARLSELEVSLESVLSPDESRGAFCFRFTRDKTSFIARRGILRMILASYTGLAPAALSFTYNRFGNLLSMGAYNLKFNMARSGDLAVYAVARHRDVGVDIECFQQRGFEILGIAALLFSKEEIAALNDIPAQQREEPFLQIWTRF